MRTAFFRDPPKMAMLASLLIALLMLGGKMAAYFITGSAAIFSDALESVVHLFATGFAGFSLWYAVRPPDKGHPYGHGKIAYFSAGFEGALICIAALFILYAAIKALIEGPSLRQLNIGLLITAGLMIVNLVLGLTLIRVGQKHHSLVLISNGQHVLTDMWTSLGVLIGIGLVWGTGMLWLDPVVAIFMALNILWTAAKLIRRSFTGLMEEVDEHDTGVIMFALQQAVEEQVISSYHQLRHRRVNNQRWVEYHLQFPENLSITEAHSRSHSVEERVNNAFPHHAVFVTAHLEPDAHDAAHPSGHNEPQDPFIGKEI